MKRGTDIPLLQSEVVRITLSADVVTSPRYTREPPHFLADFGSFSRFRLQEKHNASLFQYVLQRWHYCHNALQRYSFSCNKVLISIKIDNITPKIGDEMMKFHKNNVNLPPNLIS